MKVSSSERLAQYIFIRIIGKGSYGTVWLAKHKVINTNVAIKVYNKKNLGADLPCVLNEIEIFKSLDFPYIASFFELIEHEDMTYIVMENCERDSLLSYINSSRFVSEANACSLFQQLVLAIEYLHCEKYIAHRDLKLENLMFDRHQNIRIIDFGLSHSCKDVMNTSCGSLAYIAPEVINGESYTESADIWSLGVILYSLITGYLPFGDDSESKLAQKILYMDADYPKEMSTELIDLLNKMLTRNPNQRITIKDIKVHPWVTQNSGTILKDLDEMVQKSRAIALKRLAPFNVTEESLEDENNVHEISMFRITYKDILTGMLDDSRAIIKSAPMLPHVRMYYQNTPVLYKPAKKTSGSKLQPAPLRKNSNSNKYLGLSVLLNNIG